MSCMRDWSDLTISPGLVKYFLDGSWWLEHSHIDSRVHVLSCLLVQQPSKLVVEEVGFG